MINRCKICDCPCPHYSNLCDTCAYIEEEEKIYNEGLKIEEIEQELEE